MSSQNKADYLMPLVDGFQDHVQTGIAVLFRAYNYALHARTRRWDIAVPISELYESGLTRIDFHWLLACHFAEHAREVTQSGADHRSFAREGRAVFHDQSCFVLTPQGAKFAAALLRLPSIVAESAQNFGSKPDSSEASQAVPSSPLSTDVQCGTPVWDARHRELWVGEVLVKRFRVNANNQETILSAFEEEGWPERIDDPLSPTPDVMPKRRLHDAVCGLNRNQVNHLIRFSGNGSGDGVRWEIVGGELS